MWGPSLIIDHLAPEIRAEELRGKEEDKLILTWEQRRWLRGRYTTVHGRNLGIALPTGTAPAPDAILHVATDWFLRLEAAVEPVLEISPSGYHAAMKIAFEVGNRHFPLALENGKILVPDDKAMVRLMERLGAAWERRQAIFDPIGSTQSHQHGFLP